MLILIQAILFSLLARPQAAPIDHCDSVIIADARAALGALESADRVHRGPGSPMISAASGSVALREIAGPETRRQIESILVHQGRVARQAAAGKPFVEDPPESAGAGVADVARWLPSTAVRAALRAGPSCRGGPPVGENGQLWSPVTFAEASGAACTLFIDGGHRVVRIESLSAHQRLGDTCDWTRFDGWEERDGAWLPVGIARFIVLGASSVRYDLKLAADRPGPASGDAFLLPHEHRKDIPTWGQAKPTAEGMEFVPLAPTVWSVEIAASNSRILVIERAADLVVLGAPDGDAVCGRVVLALAERFPGKPIGRVAFGHHHPSPSGGLRALAAAGATVVCPRDLEPHVRGLLGRPASLGLPAVRGPAEPRLELFEGEMTIDCGEQSVRLINIGERSAHAFSYVVFYFPSLGLVFEDDLGYFPIGGAARVNPRLEGLAAHLGSLGIEPKRLIQSWPVRDVLREVEWSVVAEMVKAERVRRQAK